MKKRIVKELHFNWFQSGSTQRNDGAGEDYTIVRVGQNGVTDIIENEPRSGNQVWNYEIICDSGDFRIFNPNYVLYL